ncbi:MAG: hypothetical protein CVV44_20240 [Spirochaetae bacterium HGW-Spirochaetae-1]|jgi:hypothetical protein|nr:MAG: hypothetical protein CVV44_20240 [Spirochaetae bacterium HGW-Spirochaetae-1]
MSEDYIIVRTETLDGGLFAERINDAIQECLANIYDPNVEQEKVREVQAIIKLKPSSSDSRKVAVFTQVKTKLSQPTPSETIIFAGTKDGEYVAYEQNLNQGNFSFDGEGGAAGDNIVKMKTGGGE